jgi:hypothetical protein
MRRTRWLPWARAALACAFVGHVAGDVVFDEREFAHARVPYRWAASEPLVVQAVVVVLAIALLGPLARRAASRRRAAGRGRLIAAFVASQLAVFTVLESTERLAQGEPFVRGLFTSLFVPELVVAVAVAVALAVLASIAVRIVRSTRRPDRGVELCDAPCPLPRSIAPRVLAPLGLGVRAPPLVAG